MAQSLEERFLRIFEALLAVLGLFRGVRDHGRREVPGGGGRLALSFRHRGRCLVVLLASDCWLEILEMGAA